jgi:hypothetical protein
MTLHELLTAVGQYQAVIALFTLAVISTMPEQPPAAWLELPRWIYYWTHDALKMFVSFKAPQAIATRSASTTRPDGVISTVKESLIVPATAPSTAPLAQKETTS